MRIQHTDQTPRQADTCQLSVAMIVRDEGARIGAALASVSAIADELVVVDTGSTDDTVLVAIGAGATVLQAEWTDDFAAARNVALAGCHGRWILILDADEALSPDSLETVREIAATLPDGPTALDVTIRSWTNDGNGTGFDHRAVRLFSRHPEIQYEGRIHERLTHRTLGETGIRWQIAAGVLIEHWGYLQQEKTAKRKSERNQRLLEAAITDHPDDPAGYYHLGMWHASEQRPGDALAALDRTLALAKGLPSPPVYLAPTYILKVASLIALGEHALALAVAPDAETVCKGEPDYWFNIGIAHQAGHDHEAALAAFRRCLALRGAQPYMAEHGTRGWKTCLAMAASFDALGNRTAAMAARWESLRDFPGQPVLHGKLWAQAWLDGDDTGKTECHDLWQALPAQARTTIAALAIDTLATMGAWEPAEILARDLLGQMPTGERSAIVARLAELFRRRGAAMERAALLMACQQEPGVLRMMADDQRQQGDWVGYERSCRQLIEAGEDLAEAQAGLGAALLRQGDADGADAALQAAIAHGSADASVWNNLGVIALGRQQVDAATEHFREATRLQPDHFSANLNLVRTAWWRQDMPDAQTHLATAVGVLEGLIATAPGAVQQAAVADFEALQRYFRGWDMRRARQAEMTVPPGTDEFLATVFRTWQIIGGRLANQRQKAT